MKRAIERIQNRHERYRKLLADKHAELLASLGETRFDTLSHLGRIAEEDQAMLSHEEFIGLSRNSMDFGNLRQVEAALARIAAGAYGICAECEEEISEKRLAAVPWAEYCIGCQARLADAASPHAA
jgi:DnaK suppressor protein